VTDHVTTEALRRIRSISNGIALHTPRFDFTRAIRQAAFSPGKRLDGYEGERHTELLRRHAKHLPDSGGYFLVDGSDLAPYMTRADTVLPASAGGYTVGTELAPDFIELARPRSVIGALGATFISDLVGNVSFGRLAGSAVSVNWSQTETSAPSDGVQTFSQLSMTPKQVSINMRLSRTLVEQTSRTAQGLIVDDLARGIGTAVDVVALSTTPVAAGAPVGIPDLVPAASSISGTSTNNTTVIGLQALTAKRLSPFGGYAAPVAISKTLCARLRDATNNAFYVWEGGLWNGRIAGQRAIASDDVPSGTLIFGNWDNCLIGSWGALAVEVSPFGLSPGDFQAGTIALRIILLVDIAVRDPLAFAVATGVT
jgi:HK97 family phage major capsid protein